MQQIMDEELAWKLVEDERKALAQRMAQDEAAARALAALQDDSANDDEDEVGSGDATGSSDDDDNSDDGDEYSAAAIAHNSDDDDEDDDEFDYMDEYSTGDGKRVSMLGQYVPLQNTTKGFNSLRESLRRQDKGDSRKGPVRNVLESSKFASRDSAFDERTRMVLLKLMNRGKLDAIHERINTGREANTYRAVGSDAETSREVHYAVKLFKTSRGDFSKANECDPSGRVYNANFIKKTLRRQLKEWTEREYRNLRRAASCGVQVPAPLLFKDHVLVMRFVGDTATDTTSPTPAPKLKDTVLSKAQLHAAYVDVLRSMRALYQNAQLVHARLSDANILYHDGRCWLVDLSEAAERSHPDHTVLLEQDLARVHGFFQSRGVRRAAKDLLGLLPDATARDFVTSDDPESVLKWYAGLRKALLTPASVASTTTAMTAVLQ